MRAAALRHGTAHAPDAPLPKRCPQLSLGEGELPSYELDDLVLMLLGLQAARQTNIPDENVGVPPTETGVEEAPVAGFIPKSELLAEVIRGIIKH